MTGPVGGYDEYITLAVQYNWTPEQVNRMDPDFINEILTRLTAEWDAEKAKRKAEERKRKRARGDSVDIAEIT